MDALGQQFHLNKEQIGAIAGIAFLGFTVAIFFGGQVVDALGMGRVLAPCLRLPCYGHCADHRRERLLAPVGRERCCSDWAMD